MDLNWTKKFRKKVNHNRCKNRKSKLCCSNNEENENNNIYEIKNKDEKANNYNKISVVTCMIINIETFFNLLCITYNKNINDSDTNNNNQYMN